MTFNPDPKHKTQAASSWNQTRLKGWRSKSKYRNVTTEYNGLKYDSKLEAKVAQDLDWKMKIGEIKEWRRQVKIPLAVNGVHITNYYIDFIYTDKHGQRVYLEAKGMETDVFKMKWRLLTALINEIDEGAEMIMVKA